MAFSFFMKKKPGQDRKGKPRQIPKIEEFKRPHEIKEVSKAPEKSIPKPLVRPIEKLVDKLIEKPLKSNGDKPFYAFIDASNIFWGGKESIGFGVDYKKLKEHLENKFGVTRIFYYEGVRIFDYPYSMLDRKGIDFVKLTEHLKKLQEGANDKEKELIEKTLSKINFLQRLEEFGYDLKIKPAKVFYGEEDEKQECPFLKANCDVDMTFDMMRYMEQYSGIIAMTGDGDFVPVLNYLKNHDRKVVVLSRWERTAKEIKEIAADNFIDFSRLRNIIKYR